MGCCAAVRRRCSLSALVVVAFALYFALTLGTIGSLFFPLAFTAFAPAPPGGVKYLECQWGPETELSVLFFISPRAQSFDASRDLVASLPPRPLAQGGALEGVELTLPSVAELRKRTRGLFLHALVVPSRLLSRAVSDAERRAESIHLVSDLVKSLPLAGAGDVSGDAEMPHVRTQVHVELAADFRRWPTHLVPDQLRGFFARQPAPGRYLPLVLVTDDLWARREWFTPANETVTRANFTFSYSPVSLGWLRLSLSLYHSFALLERVAGAGEVEEVKVLFSNTEPALLVFTMLISALHLLLDSLALISDVNFWRSRSDFEGLSLRSLMLSAASKTVICLFLVDNKAGWLVLGSVLSSTLLSYWKIAKATRLHCSLRTMSLTREQAPPGETKTAQLDAEANRVVSWLLWPVLFLCFAYSWAFRPVVSWYSWVLATLASVVYSFGFLAMTPQVYVNYRLRSVAHMPWAALVYSALNTFIDDLFAFLIKMPTMHRLSTLRDDVIFFVLLYQRCAYSGRRGGGGGAKALEAGAAQPPPRSKEAQARTDEAAVMTEAEMISLAQRMKKEQ